jgi:DNA-binding MarR family transcriptional regulator
MSDDQAKYCGCLYYAANNLARVITRMAEEEFRTTGLAPSYAFLLMSVNDQPGISAGDISRQLALSPSTVTRFIEKLEHKGYLERKAAGKFTQVYPTESGRKIRMKIQEAWMSLYKRYSALLGEEMAGDLTDKIYLAAQALEPG